jgi:hypothetical protein
MQLNGFTVEIPECKEETNTGYVILKHNENFRIKLRNHHKKDGHGTPSDADVYVNGIFTGSFRIDYGQTVSLEHPLNDSGKFTAYRNGSNEANQIGLDPNSEDNGLIKVVWKPGNYKVRSIPLVVTPDWSWPYNPSISYPLNDNYYDDGHYINIHHTYNTAYSSTRSTTSGYDNNAVCSCISANHNNDLVGGGIGLSGNSNQTFTETDSLEYTEQSTTIFLKIAFRDSEPRPIKPVYKVHSTSIPRTLR